MTIEGVLLRAGLQCKGDVIKSISELQEPPLSEATIKIREKRGNTSVKPLVDTGYMKATVAVEVL